MPYVYVFKLTTAASTNQASAGTREVFELHTKPKIGSSNHVRFRRGWLSSYPTVVTFSKDAVVEDSGRAIRIDEHLEVILVRSLLPWKNGFAVCSQKYVEKFVRYRRVRMNMKDFIEWTHWSDNKSSQ